jgi:glycosyltransferase involved in cell wall biosynthesis
MSNSVAYLFPDFFFIGAQRAAAATIRKMVGKGWNVSVIVFTPTTQMRKEIPDSVRIVELPKVPLFSSIPFVRIFTWPFSLKYLFEIEKPQYCISICPQTNFSMVLYRIFFRRDVVFVGEEHQHLSNAIKNDPGDFKKPWKYFYYFSLKNYWRLDVLRCVSCAAADDFVKNWGVPRDKVRTIYPAFDLETIQHRSHGAQRSNPVPVVCSVGRLTSQKDFALLIRAFAHVTKHCNALLKIAGTGPEKEPLEALITELGLQQHVTLLGFVEYAEELIASSDVFVMTSIWEGFPATLVESMVLGTPVISVNCESGPAELIEHGVTGMLVDQRDPIAIGEAIMRMLGDTQERQAMSRSAQERVQQFSLDSTVTELESLLLSFS